MTTIAVVKKNGLACIAADTLSSFGSTKIANRYTIGASKIIKVDDTSTATSYSGAGLSVTVTYD